jgi:hypothetical protein
LDSFTKLAPRLKNELKDAGHDVDALHKRIKKLTDDYEARFATIRDKFGAHQQELPLADTISYWLDIDFVSMGYFRDECMEIYNDMHALDATVFEPYVDSADQGNGVLASSLNSIPSKDTVFSLGVDRLALTRPRTVAMVGIAPMHRKAQLIVSIIDMQVIEGTVWASIGDGYADMDIALRSLMITDHISLLHNLYPIVPATNPHREDSFLEVLRSAAVPSKSYLEGSFALIDQSLLNGLTTVRNKIGAHIDTNSTLSDLTSSIEAVAIEEVGAENLKHMAAFTSTCSRDIRLRLVLPHGGSLGPDVVGVEKHGGSKGFGE